MPQAILRNTIQLQAYSQKRIFVGRPHGKPQPMRKQQQAVFRWKMIRPTPQGTRMEGILLSVRDILADKPLTVSLMWMESALPWLPSVQSVHMWQERYFDPLMPIGSRQGEQILISRALDFAVTYPVTLQNLGL